MIFRHEYKYLVTHSQAEILMGRLTPILTVDKHTENRSYTIRSIYYDDIEDNCYYDTENGNDPREKIRIRIYNTKTDYISLECKRKEHSLTQKTSSLLSYKQCMELINRIIPDDLDPSDPVIAKMIDKIKCHGYYPKTIVEYDRVPLVYPDGNTRITFDYNLRASSAIGAFFDNNLHTRSIMPKGKLLLEVKYDEFLPVFINNMLQIDDISQTSFSKYYYCRKFTKGLSI